MKAEIEVIKKEIALREEKEAARLKAKTKWMPPVKYREASMCST